MENQNEEWDRTHDMPHEHYMDTNDLEFHELPARIQREIRAFDVFYNDALFDGVDENERQALLNRSDKIKSMMQEVYEEKGEHEDTKGEDNQRDENGGFGIWDVLLWSSAAFGIGYVIKKGVSK